MSMREKLSWARQHGVTPPDYVLVAAVEEAAEETAESSSCCHRDDDRVASCCAARGKQAERSCCSAKAARSESAAQGAKATEDADGRSIDWVIGLNAQKCQGLTLLWLTSGAIAPPPVPVELPTDFSPPTWCAAATPRFWRNLSIRPDVPPPRRA